MCHFTRTLIAVQQEEPPRKGLAQANFHLQLSGECCKGYNHVEVIHHCVARRMAAWPPALLAEGNRTHDLRVHVVNEANRLGSA